MMSPRSRRALLIAIISCLGVLSVPARDAAAAEHSWTDSSGQFSVEAGLVEFDEATGTVVLEKADGAVIRVPLAKLSAESQAQARRLAAEQESAEPLLASPSSFPPGFDPRTVIYDCPDVKNPFSQPENVLIAPTLDLAVVTHCRDRGEGLSVWCDLRTGFAVEPPFDYPREHFVIEAFSPDGEHLIAREKTEISEPDRLSLWKINGNSLEEVRQFVPFGRNPREVRDVIWCNSRYIFLVSDQEAAFLLRASDFEVAAKFNQGADYAVSADGTAIAFMRPEGVAFYSLEDAQPVVRFSTPPTERKSTLPQFGGAFSPDAQRFAFIYEDVLRVVDAHEGTLLRELTIPNIRGFRQRHHMYWYAGGLVVVNNKALVDVDAGKLLQTYDRAPDKAAEFTYFDRYMFYPRRHAIDHSFHLCLFEFPSEAKSESMGVPLTDMTSYKAGKPVALDVSGCEIPELSLANIEKKIRESNKAVPFVDPGEPADFRFVVRASQGPAEDIGYTVRTIHSRERVTPMSNLERITYSDERRSFHASKTYEISYTLYHGEAQLQTNARRYPTSHLFESGESPESYFREQMRPKLEWFQLVLPGSIRSESYRSGVESFLFQGTEVTRKEVY